MEYTRLGPNQFRCRQIGVIGEGGLGTVFEVQITHSASRWLPIGSRWACKLLNEACRRHSTMQVRFEREIHAVKQMDHSGIVSYMGESLPGGPAVLSDATLRRQSARRSQSLPVWNAMG